MLLYLRFFRGLILHVLRIFLLNEEVHSLSIAQLVSSSDPIILEVCPATRAPANKVSQYVLTAALTSSRQDFQVLLPSQGWCGYIRDLIGKVGYEALLV